MMGFARWWVWLGWRLARRITVDLRDFAGVKPIWLAWLLLVLGGSTAAVGSDWFERFLTGVMLVFHALATFTASRGGRQLVQGVAPRHNPHARSASARWLYWVVLASIGQPTFEVGWAIMELGRMAACVTDDGPGLPFVQRQWRRVKQALRAPKLAVEASR